MLTKKAEDFLLAFNRAIAEDVRREWWVIVEADEANTIDVEAEVEDGQGRLTVSDAGGYSSGDSGKSRL